MLKLSQPQIVKGEAQATYQVDVASEKENRTLWYRLHESNIDLISDSSDAALVALLIPAMATGEDIHISGRVSEKLLYSCSEPLQAVLKSVIPSLKKIKIHAETIDDRPAERASGVATGFSAGVDSYCVLADHYDSKVADGFKVTHLLFNNVGSHGKGGENLFKERYERLLPTAKLLKLPLVMVDSNLDEFYFSKRKEIRSPETGGIFEQTHTLRNASVALFLQGGIGRYLYASAYEYKDIFVGPTGSMAYSDAVTLPLLSTETLDTLSVGSQYNRVQKTLRVAEVPTSYKTLDVCASDSKATTAPNCSKCGKCLRTLVTLEIAGRLEQYSESFDLSVYRTHRERYMAELLGSRKLLSREVAQFAKARGYRFPLLSYLVKALRISGLYATAKLSQRAILSLKQLRNSLSWTSPSLQKQKPYASS